MFKPNRSLQHNGELIEDFGKYIEVTQINFGHKEIFSSDHPLFKMYLAILDKDVKS